MPIRLGKCVFVFAMALLMFSKGHAGEFTIKNRLTLLTEYYSRGITQTQERPAPQFMSTIFHDSGVFGGLFVSRVEFLDGDEADQELDFFLAYHKSIEDFYYRIGVIYYTFPDARRALDYNFWELDIGLGYNFGPLYSEISLKTSPDHYGSSGHNRYVKLEAHLPVVEEKLKLKSHIAHRYIEDNAAFGNVPDNFDWEVGFEYRAIKNTDLILKYVDSSFSRTDCFNTDFCDERFIAGIAYNF